MGLFLKKNRLLRYWDSLSLLNWIGACYIVSIAETLSKKNEILILSMKFVSYVVVLYLYKSIIGPYMEYRCHVWASDPSCYLDILKKLQKRISRTIGPSPATSL